jgi:ferredoxin--NADP+ reductase
MPREKERVFEVEILENKSISKDSAILSFKRIYAFRAGQVIGITTSKALPQRLYSICSAEKNNNIEILYKIVPEGALTPKLEDLITGDRIYITEPFGKFTTNNDPAYFIATGTGIAPYLSMIKSGFGDNKILLHGCRSHEDFYEADFLK